MNENDILVEGIKDRIIDAFLKRFIDLDAIKAGDINAIDAAIKSALTMFAPEWLDEEKEIMDIVREAVKDDRDIYAIVYEFGDALVKFAGPRRKVQEGGTIRVMARKSIDEFTAADSLKWWGSNRAEVRIAARDWLVKRRLSKCPEVLAMLEGNVGAAELQALSPDQVVRLLEVAIKALGFFAVVWPPAGLIAIALQLVLNRYKNNHPDVGLSITALAY